MSTDIYSQIKSRIGTLKPAQLSVFAASCASRALFHLSKCPHVQDVLPMPSLKRLVDLTWQAALDHNSRSGLRQGPAEADLLGSANELALPHQSVVLALMDVIWQARNCGLSPDAETASEVASSSMHATELAVIGDEAEVGLVESIYSEVESDPRMMIEINRQLEDIHAIQSWSPSQELMRKLTTFDDLPSILC